MTFRNRKLYRLYIFALYTVVFGSLCYLCVCLSIYLSVYLYSPSRDHGGRRCCAIHYFRDGFQNPFIFLANLIADHSPTAIHCLILSVHLLAGLPIHCFQFLFISIIILINLPFFNQRMRPKRLECHS
jgi:hypothetical protein